MHELIESIYVNEWYWLLRVVAVFAIIVALVGCVRALFQGTLFCARSCTKFFSIIAFAIPAIAIEAWYFNQMSQARAFVEREAIDRLRSYVAKGICSWNELPSSEMQLFKDLRNRNDLPYFLKGQELSPGFDRNANTGCMINVGFRAPMNRLTRTAYGDAPDPDSEPSAPKSRPSRFVTYFWSENKNGTARQGW